MLISVISTLIRHHTQPRTSKDHDRQRKEQETGRWRSVHMYVIYFYACAHITLVLILPQSTLKLMGNNILRTLAYRSIINHCDVIGEQSNQIR